MSHVEENGHNIDLSKPCNKTEMSAGHREKHGTHRTTDRYASYLGDLNDFKHDIVDDPPVRVLKKPVGKFYASHETRNEFNGDEAMRVAAKCHVEWATLTTWVNLLNVAATRGMFKRSVDPIDAAKDLSMHKNTSHIHYPHVVLYHNHDNS